MRHSNIGMLYIAIYCSYFSFGKVIHAQVLLVLGITKQIEVGHAYMIVRILKMAVCTHWKYNAFDQPPYLRRWFAVLIWLIITIIIRRRLIAEYI
jgi:hypothetical protein